MSMQPSWPALRTVLVAAAAAALALVLWRLLPPEVPRYHSVLWLLAAGAAAAAFIGGKTMGLGTAWLALAVIATPALVLVPIYRPPVWIFPLCVLVLAGFYINGVKERVPLYLSNLKTRATIAGLLPTKEGAQFIDLGCGLGGIVIDVARENPQAHAIGVETAPLSYVIAKLRTGLLSSKNAEVRFQSIWDTDVSTADVVYAFLSPAPMTRLNEKLRAEMKPGSIFISNSFAVPGTEPDTVVQVDDARQTQLLIWRM